MKKNDMKRDQYIKSIVEEAGLEHPSHDFTQKIMEALDAQSAPHLYAYEPLISKKAWVFIALSGLALLLLITLTHSGQPTASSIPHVDLNLYLTKFAAFFAKVDLSFLSSPVPLMAAGGFLILLFADMIFWVNRHKVFLRK